MKSKFKLTKKQMEHPLAKGVMGYFIPLKEINLKFVEFNEMGFIGYYETPIRAADASFKWFELGIERSYYQFKCIPYSDDYCDCIEWEELYTRNEKVWHKEPKPVSSPKW